MKVLLSRLQFSVTITYHFLFVPLTVGLALLVAVMQVLVYTHQAEAWERLSRPRCRPGTGRRRRSR